MARRTEPDESCVALLRAVNVGGKNRLPMRDLVSVFEAAGARAVTTFIQSGNVLFRAPVARCDAIARAVEASIEARHGFAAPVVLRTAAELLAVVSENPFLAGLALGAEPPSPTKALFVGFLGARPTAAAAAKLDPARSPGDAFELRGRELYLRLGTSAAKTKLTAAWFDGKLGTVTTMRNWSTVLELARRAAA